jgi:hypothetical protein
LNRNRILLIVFIGLIILILSINFNITHIMASNNSNMTNIMASNNSAIQNNSSKIKVLIFDGDGVMGSSVEGIIDCLNESNNQNLPGNNKFEYSTTDVINSNSLSGYDVLVMPGGDAPTYLSNDEIDSASIKQFVQGGKGYLGICAGAYAASNYVRGYYSGWGLTPDVNTINEEYEGLLSISTTSYGNTVFNGSQTNIHMENGPAMYTNNSQIVLATFAKITTPVIKIILL